MLARLAFAAAALLLVVAAPESSASAMAANATDGELCCEFVRSSLAVQRELAEKVKQLSGRKVYLFDATGFAAAFVDDITVDNIRFKSGEVDGVVVDAVLSLSAQRTLSGRAGAETYRRWMGSGSGTVDANGVHI